MADEQRTCCTSHCSRCGRHFHSLKAYDVHLEHDETGWPHCLSPVDLEDTKDRLMMLTEHGECRLYDTGTGANVERDVVVWTHAADYARAMARWHAEGLESPVQAA